MQPTLVTARLVLRPATETDGEALWTLWTDPLVRRFLWDDRVIDRNEAMATVTECCALAPQALGLWMLEANRNEPSPSPFPDGTVVGCAGLLPVSVAAEFEPQLAGLIEPLVPSRRGRQGGTACGTLSMPDTQRPFFAYAILFC